MIIDIVKETMIEISIEIITLMILGKDDIETEL